MIRREPGKISKIYLQIDPSARRILGSSIRGIMAAHSPERAVD